MQFFVVVKLMLSLLPIITQLVQAMEAAFPGPGQGPAKLAAVVSAVKGAELAVPIQVTDEHGPMADQVGQVPGIEAGIVHMVSTVVSLFNQAGIFKK